MKPSPPPRRPFAKSPFCIRPDSRQNRAGSTLDSRWFALDSYLFRVGFAPTPSISRRHRARFASVPRHSPPRQLRTSFTSAARQPPSAPHRFRVSPRQLHIDSAPTPPAPPPINMMQTIMDKKRRFLWFFSSKRPPARAPQSTSEQNAWSKASAVSLSSNGNRETVRFCPESPTSLPNQNRYELLFAKRKEARTPQCQRNRLFR